jgi:NAD(P)-dependent dehydrogenase (short-subunit alcohol dehydrogenase family)
LAKKTALITGCSAGGIGHALAGLLGGKGYRVLATVRNPAKAEALEDDAKANGWDLRILQLDVCDDASVKAAVAEAGHIDILVNNAGFEVWGPIEEMTVGDIKDQFETNVYGPFRLITAIAPAMRNRGEGVIINVSSVVGRVAAPLNGIYASSKWALEALSESLHYELGHFGVRVHIIEPGGVETSFGNNRRLVGAAAGKESPYTQLVTEWQQVAQRLNPGGSVATPEDVAAVILDAIETGDKLRYPVGQDAALVINARKAMSDEQFETAMRTQLGLTW